MSMKLEESEEKVNELVKQRMKELHNKGQYDLSQSPEEYEKIIQKLEAEVRNHISVQQQMKLYIESYQSKVEELEPLEKANKKIEKEMHKQRKEYEDKLERITKELHDKQSSYKRKLVEQEREYEFKIEDLESKLKDLQSRLGKFKTSICCKQSDNGSQVLDSKSTRDSVHHSTSLSRHESKSKYFHKKNEVSVDLPESQK